MAYSTKDIADRLGVTTPSIRKYTTEFSEFLSEDAQTREGRRREFTDEDLNVLWVARQLLEAGLTYDETRDRLAQGVQNLIDEFGPPPAEETEAEEAEGPATGTAMINMGQFRALVAPLESAAAEWRQLAEDRRIENEELREENRRLREELRRREERSEEARRSWWDRLLGR